MGVFERASRALASAQALLGTLIPEIPTWAQFSRIGGGVGPSQVTSIIREADGGRPARLVDLLHECRQKDGHLQAVLGVRELAIAGLKWSVTPPKDATEPEKDAAAKCQAALLACDGFHVLLAHLTGEGCLFPTGAWAEIVWKVETEGERAGLEVPALFKPISPRRFGFRSTDGRLVFVEYGKDPSSSGVDLLEKYGPGNFVYRLPRTNGDVAIREGLARVLVWAAVFRNWAIRDWLYAGEMSWKPWRLAKYERALEKTSRTQAESALETLTASGAAFYPDSIDLRVEWPKNSGAGTQSTHRELCEFFGQEESKPVLGQTLTTEAGSRGARSLGQVHDNIRRDIRDADAVDVAGAMNRDVVLPFYAFNYSRSIRPGVFKFATEDGVDMTTLADVIDKIADRVAIPAAWVRDQLGIPDPTDEDELCGTRGGTQESPDDSGSQDDTDDDSGSDDGE